MHIQTQALGCGGGGGGDALTIAGYFSSQFAESEVDSAHSHSIGIVTRLMMRITRKETIEFQQHPLQ